MCELGSLRSIRVRAKGVGPVTLCAAGSDVRVGAIHAYHGWLPGIVGDNGWMGVPHPDKGLLGLPLSDEFNSWKWAWEKDIVSIQIFEKNGWADVDDWTQIEAITASP